MRFRRRTLPPELDDALRAARRRDRGIALRRFARRALTVAVPAAALLVGSCWYLAAPSAPPLPRVVEGPGSAPPAGGHFTVRVSVVDGDTLATGGDRLRIHGIDAPESGQDCERRGASYACGAAARDAMAAILGRGLVACQQLDTDQYGRRIVRCHNEQGTDIGAELVRQGWAIAFRRFSLDYVPQETEARAARRGLWEGRFEEPSDWRRRHRQ